MEPRLFAEMLKLCLVTDRRRSLLPLPEAVAGAAAGGVTAVQLREKDLPHDELCDLASRVREVLAGSSVLFTINNDLDAAASFAQGVHLGRGVASVPEARSRGIEIVGVSTHSREEAAEAEQHGASYVFFGPIFPTASKPGAQPQGLKALCEVSAAVTIPLVAIGGINHENVADALSAGADGVAVVSSILASKDPRAAAALLQRAMQRS